MSTTCANSGCEYAATDSGFCTFCTESSEKETMHVYASYAYTLPDFEHIRVLSENKCVDLLDQPEGNSSFEKSIHLKANQWGSKLGALGASSLQRAKPFKH